MRLPIALAITALVIVAGAALAFVALNSRNTPSVIASYLPADTAMYVELRLDLPGDQGQNLASFASHFPGFDDVAVFEEKVTSQLSEMISESSDGEVEFERDLASWATGQAGVAVLEWTIDTMPMVDGESFTSPSMAETANAFLVGLEVKDRAALEATIERLRPRMEGDGTTFASEAYLDQTIWTAHNRRGELDGAYVITSDALLIAPTVERIKTALDIKAEGASSLSDATRFKDALAGLTADHVSRMYFDARPLIASALASIEQFSQTAAGADCLDVRALLEQLPDAYGATARLEADRALFESRSVATEASVVPTSRSTTLAERFGSDTAIYFEVRDVGIGVKAYIEQLKGCTGDDAEPILEQVEQFLGAELQDAFAFLGDTAIGVTANPDQAPSVGIVAQITDAEAARTRVQRLLDTVRLFAMVGSGNDAPITFEEIDHGGTTITRIAVAPEALPPEANLPIDLSLSIAFDSEQLLIGSGDFVARALDRQAEDSLAQSERYAEGVRSAGGETNAGLVYVDLAALRSTIEGVIPDEDRTRYETEVRPYLEPVDRFVTVTTIDGSDTIARAILFLK